MSYRSNKSYLVVGLGNPGKEYAKTRHNLGFMVADELIKKTGAVSVNTKLNADVWTAKINAVTVFLMKPLTFMNKSGQAVGSFAKTKKITLEHLIVVHDDMDLPFSTVRVSKDSSAAGHNGVQSVIAALGTQDFVRVRLGIGRPHDSVPAEDFVLARFSGEEEKQLPSIIDQAILEIEKIFQR
jgi:PTH1 family peptidyl-tRNA hydrolase